MRLVTYFTLATLTHIKFCLPTFEQTLSDQDFRFHFRGWHILLPRLPLKQGVLVGGAIQSTVERMQLYFAMNLTRMFSYSPDNGIANERGMHGQCGGNLAESPESYFYLFSEYSVHSTDTRTQVNRTY
jgi:hypothetical protein